MPTLFDEFALFVAFAGEIIFFLTMLLSPIPLFRAKAHTFRRALIQSGVMHVLAFIAANGVACLAYSADTARTILNVSGALTVMLVGLAVYTGIQVAKK